MNIEQDLTKEFIAAVKNCYQSELNQKSVQIQKTKVEFQGQYTFVVFPFLKISKKSPEQTAEQLGDYLKNNSSLVDDFNVVKGFLNLVINSEFWIKTLLETKTEKNITNSDSKTIMVEYSSPNTNKPLPHSYTL